jgi:hypothetical protein
MHENKENKKLMTIINLKDLSKYKLKKMFDNGEIHKCPKCKNYHDSNKEYDFITNRTLCEKCQERKDYYKNWSERKGEKNK